MWTKNGGGHLDLGRLEAGAGQEPGEQRQKVLGGHRLAAGARRVVVNGGARVQQVFQFVQRRRGPSQFLQHRNPPKKEFQPSSASQNEDKPQAITNFHDK